MKKIEKIEMKEKIIQFFIKNDPYYMWIFLTDKGNIYAWHTGNLSNRLEKINLPEELTSKNQADKIPVDRESSI